MLGHRGSPREVLENTLPSFRLALEDGADGFETDLRSTADGAIVLVHDERHRRRPIRSMTFAELQSQAGDLAELSDLEPLAGRCRMVLEVKEAGFEKRLAAIVRDWPGIIVASFDHTIIRRLSDLDVPFDLGVTVGEYRADGATLATVAGAQWFFPRWNRIDESLARRCFDAGIGVIPWSPNRSSTWGRLRRMGCAGVITDVPRHASLWRRDSG